MELVPAPTEHHLLKNAGGIIRSIARESLIAFSLRKLKDAKLATANFKSGFDFTDSYYAKYDRKKLYTMIVNGLLKNVAFLPTYAPGFICIGRESNPAISIKLVNDRSTLKYIQKIHTLASTYVPILRLTHTTISDAEVAQYGSGIVRCGYIMWTIRANTGSGTDYLQYYKVMFFIPEILTILKTLSRKAYFEDELFRSQNRYEGSAR